MKPLQYSSSGPERRPGEFVGDMASWLRENADDNSERLERLKRGLRLARTEELTPRQTQLLEMHFEKGMSMAEISRDLGLNISTVSRTLHRAKKTLFRCLRYGL